jgi:hypothetical protein
MSVHVVDATPLRYLVSLPGRVPAPVLCFLHGYDEAAPAEITHVLALHSPLRADASALTREFIIVAPQLPTRGDHWYRYAGDVRDIVLQVQAEHGGDAGRTYLTGFSFGGNGVLDLGQEQADLWAALWPVDPTRVPRVDPGTPVWLSGGALSRRLEPGFVDSLGLQRAAAGAAGDRVLTDEGADHVGTAALAYADDRIYEWLLARRLRASA